MTEKKRYAADYGDVDDRSHIPYRNSKLTHLLENALGGDSNICVICTLSAEEPHHAETLETLKFAGRCSQVETRAKKNVVSPPFRGVSYIDVQLLSNDQALIKAKDQEIMALRRQLQTIRPPMATAESIDQLSDVILMKNRKGEEG